MTVVLTKHQKLDAIDRYFYQYGRQNWEPKEGDYYTLTRNAEGVELFQIVEDTGDQFKVKLIYSESREDTPADAGTFDKADFLEGFGEHRVYVPYDILTQDYGNRND